MPNPFERHASSRARTDFFGRQDDAIRATRRMLVVFGLAVISVVVLLLGALCLIKAAIVYPLSLDRNWGLSPWPQASTLIVLGIIIIALLGLVSWSRIRELGDGGWVVMRGIGASDVDPDTTDPAHRQLCNVVQELAIAAAVPVPDLYLLEHEAGINAFCAGHGPADAALCVTRGCLDRLSRDELQGVIAHEFSHIVHGDMRLNIRLIGLLAGVFFVATTGRSLMRGDLFGSLNGGPGVIGAFTGLVMLCVGSIGHLFGRLTQASVSRSREFLADAAAVQYTRQQLGLVGALKKTLALGEGSRLGSFDPNEIAHMLFGEGGKWSGLLAAHPPVPKRIRALGMYYRERDIERIRKSWQEPASATAPATAPANSAHSRTDASLATAMPAPSAQAQETMPMHVLEPIAPAAVATSAGTAGDAAVATASNVLQSLPPTLRNAAVNADDAPALILALAVSAPNSALRTIQLQRIGKDMDLAMQQRVKNLLDSSGQTPPNARLPLLALALPQLRRMIPAQRALLLRTLTALVSADGRVDLHEFCMVRLTHQFLREAAQPARARLMGAARLHDCRSDYAMLCAILADHGTSDSAAARQAWQRVMDKLIPNHGLTYSVPSSWQTTLNVLLEHLDQLSPSDKRMAINGLVTLTLADRKVTLDEAELMRLVCACLHCPIPPFMQSPTDEKSR